MAKAATIVGHQVSNTVGKLLSMPYPVPFMYRQEMYYSMAGLCIGMGYPPGNPNRQKALLSTGKNALKLLGGMSKQCVWWDGKEIAYGSPEHLKVLEEVLVAKFKMNQEAREAIEWSRNLELQVPENSIEARIGNLGPKGYLELLEKAWNAIKNPMPEVPHGATATA